ncbi:MAG TPA: phosphotransferase, partial [Ilumatobacteraceae bacterium]|nr:phosphotransferase [Ilumatobacteraceae bacterium]
MAHHASGDSDLGRQLAAALGAGQVTELRQLSGGASRETWLFTADGRRLVLQRQRSGDTRDMATEVAVLQAAHRGGVPVAEVIASSSAAT